MTGPVEITIKEPYYSKPWARAMRAVLIPIVLIGVGVALDSTAMEWIGFISTFLALAIVVGVKTNPGMTIEQARAKLDEIERKISDSRKGPTQ